MKPKHTEKKEINPYAINPNTRTIPKKIYGTKEFKYLHIRSFPMSAPKLIPELLRQEINFIKEFCDLIGHVQVKTNEALKYYELHYYMDDKPEAFR